MLFGEDGVLHIEFDNYSAVEQICSVSLIFIMFYGGFGTSWKHARSTATISVLLSSAGVVITAALTGVFCHFALRMDWLPSLLVGAVISSTDAASVFSILRSRRLNLRYHTASLLEVESGSNDPFAYMLTIIVLTLMDGNANGWSMVWMLIRQLLFGAAVGAGVAWGCYQLLSRLRLDMEGHQSMFIFAAALLSYGLAQVIGGNGYLSVYITGVMLGNVRIPNKKTLVHFFDGMTGLMQILIFFLLGLLADPSALPQVALPALAIALFLTLVARPAAVFAIMSPFRCPVRQQMLVSWAGLRGAASIVFAIMATVGNAQTPDSLFNTVFFIVLFSILVQGSLLPLVSRKLDMIDQSGDVMKTFSDYSDEVPVQFLQLKIKDRHPWVDHELRHLHMLPQTRVALIIRDGQQIIPRGQTVIHMGDTVIISGPAMDGDAWGSLKEIHIDRDHEWCGQTLQEISMDKHRLVVMIRRGRKIVIPNGSTVLRERDVLILNETSRKERN